MILYGPGDDFRRRRRAAINEHNDGNLYAAISTNSEIPPLLRCAPVMGNDELILVEEHVGNSNGLIQQATGIAAEIQYQAFEVRVIELLLSSGRQLRVGVFIECDNVHIADSRLQQTRYFHGVLGNFVARDGESDWVSVTFAIYSHVNHGALWSLEQIGDFPEVVRPSVALPSTLAMTSPGRMPAFEAGEPGIGASTTVRFSCGPTVMPTP